MNKALICIGSNTSNRKAILCDTLKYLQQEGHIEASSSCYETPATGHSTSPSYLNCVLLLNTPVDYETLKYRFKIRETEAGRTPEAKIAGTVSLDIDIVIWNDLIIKPDDLNQTYMKQGLKEIIR